VVGKALKMLLMVLAAVALAPAAGCSTKDFKPSKIFSLDNAWPFDDDEDEPEEGIPVRVVGAWTDTVKTTPGQAAQRGFGGRLMFYDRENDKPILVDGQLVVYAFDEIGRAPTDNKPTRRYVFPPDQMKLHMSKNDMGASYSFWLPWDEAGGPRADVSLICRFEPKGGAVITGEQTRHVLPGTLVTQTPGAPATGPQVPEGVPMRPAQTTLESYQAQQRVQSGVQTAGYETSASLPAAAVNGVTTASSSAPAGVNDPSRQMSVTSIALPNDFQIPAGVNPQPIAKATGQAARMSQVQQPASATQYQQLQYQQPVAPMQPVMQTPQAPAMTGAAVSPQIPVGAGQVQPSYASVPRPMIAPVIAPGITVPQSQSFTPPLTAPQFVGQQPMMTQAAQPMMQQQALGVLPQQQMVAAPTQPMGTMPTQQTIQLQGYQPQGYEQQPSANGVRTAVSYGPATIPWR
jgi:hypothetical protein